MALIQSNSSSVIFDFDRNSSLRNWYSVDDNVMGGISSGRIMINEEGHGLFEGRISLENNGGFSSIRYILETLDVNPDSKVL